METSIAFQRPLMTPSRLMESAPLWRRPAILAGERVVRKKLTQAEAQSGAFQSALCSRPNPIARQVTPYGFPALAGGGGVRGRGAGSSGRWNVLSGSLLTSSMIFANARVEASRPVHGTVSGVSQSVWK